MTQTHIRTHSVILVNQFGFILYTVRCLCVCMDGGHKQQ